MTAQQNPQYVQPQQQQQQQYQHPPVQQQQAPPQYPPQPQPQPQPQQYQQPQHPPAQQPQQQVYQPGPQQSTQTGSQSGMMSLNGSSSKEEVLKNELKNMVILRGWDLLKDSRGQDQMELGFKNSNKKIQKMEVMEFKVQIKTSKGQVDAAGMAQAQNTINIMFETFFKKGFFGKGKNSFNHWLYIDDFVDQENKATPKLKEQMESFLGQAHVGYVGAAAQPAQPAPAMAPAAQPTPAPAPAPAQPAPAQQPAQPAPQPYPQQPQQPQAYQPQPQAPQQPPQQYQYPPNPQQ